MITCIVAVALVLGIVSIVLFLMEERKNNRLLRKLLSDARAECANGKQRAVVAERRAIVAERRAVEVADDRSVELVRLRQRSAEALMWFGEMEDAELTGRRRCFVSAKERLAKALGAAPASQRRAKAAS